MQRSIASLGFPGTTAEHAAGDLPPVHWSPGLGRWVVTRFGEARTILQGQGFSARHTVQQLGAPQEVDLGLFGKVPSLATTDPPQHTRLRRLVSRAFTPRSVSLMRDHVQEMVEEILAKAARRQRLDVVADLAAPVPSETIAMMLGVDRGDWARCKEWSDDLFGVFKGELASSEELDAASRAAHSLEQYLRSAIRARANVSSRQDDLLLRLSVADEEGDRLSEDEVVTAAMLVLVGGNETTTGLIVNGFGLLLDAPLVRAALSKDRALVPAAVEEFLRLSGPVHHLSRTATEPVELAGQRVLPGDQVLILTAAANRDPRRFPKPDAIDLARPSEHLAFGRGRHLCIGAPLARLEAQVVFQCFFDRFANFQLAPGCRPDWTGPLLARRLDEVSLEVLERAA